MGSKNRVSVDGYSVWDLDNDVLVQNTTSGFGLPPNASKDITQTYWIYVPPKAPTGILRSVSFWSNYRTLLGSDACAVVYGRMRA